jgi:hypothetical protein
MTDEAIMLNAIADHLEKTANLEWETSNTLRILAKIIAYIPSYERLEVITNVFKGDEENA